MGRGRGRDDSSRSSLLLEPRSLQSPQSQLLSKSEVPLNPTSQERAGPVPGPLPTRGGHSRGYLGQADTNLSCHGPICSGNQSQSLAVGISFLCGGETEHGPAASTPAVLHLPLAPDLSSCVSLSKSPRLSGAQVPHVLNGYTTEPLPG